MKAQNYYVLGSILLVAAISIMSIGVYIGFFDHSSYTIPQQIVAHIGIMFGAGILKLSYVIRLASTQHIDRAKQKRRNSEEIVEPNINTLVSFESIVEPEMTEFIRVIKPVETDMTLFVGMNQATQANPVMCEII